MRMSAISCLFSN